MANRVEAPDRKELANSPGMPKLMESGFYSTTIDEDQLLPDGARVGARGKVAVGLYGGRGSTPRRFPLEFTL